ncbi:hypothetical protein LDENG_00142170 [Lucifuga dentata]|nr:hypothetical protein LDENG_00142170 [Lucifuga dentata]
MDELDGLRLKVNPEDSATELINLEDDHYTMLQRDLECDAKELEADSWSVAVDQNYLKALNKEAIKRQDVIYELIQTEMHHVRTLKILLHVYMHELQQSLLMEEVKLDRLFPIVDFLLTVHQHFLNQLKKRCNQFREEGNPNNYQITQLGDILISQFSGDLGKRVREHYGFFCGHHSEVVSCYKEQQQSNKKLQSLMKKIGQSPLVRRLGIPECFLLVTQRITKYPVLVERIIQNTEAETEEHESLVQALGLIKDTISQVDAVVSDHKKAARLREIGLRLEPKSQGRLKGGGVFRREFLINGANTLLHEGDVTWKSLSGRNKDIHAVLLSKVLLLLQEKDQKFVFASVDNKPPVISLQKLIVREVAHEDKAMFLICATSSMPEMYEIHTSSRAERNTWMTLIWEAVNNYPKEEEDLDNEQIAVLQEYQKGLAMRDTQIVQNLTEKLQIFAALKEKVTGQTIPHMRLLLQGDATDLQQGETLLKGAIDEVESLQNLLSLRMKDSHVLVGENQMLRIKPIDSTSTASTMRNGDAAMAPGVDDTRPENGADSQLHGPLYFESLEQSADGEMPALCSNSASSPFPEAEVYDRVVMLAQRLYSLQAIIAQQDSQIELQRALLEKSKRSTRNSSDVLLEQEKQRNLEKQKEELTNFHKLQAQHQEEQQRLEKERERQRVQAEILEAQLQQRAEECRKLEKKLEEERLELKRQREAYQEDLKTLKDARQKVEKERESVEQQQEKIKRHKSMVNPGHFSCDEPLRYLAPSDFNQSFRGATAFRRGNHILTSQPYVRHSLPPANPDEIPPMVPPRKESIAPHLTKAEVPIQLISTTNQVHKPAAVQQQIPTKLAALAKGKEKSSKAKVQHQRSHSAASIDVTQVVPICSRNEGGSMRAKKSASPQMSHRTKPSNPPASVHSVKVSKSFSAGRRNSAESPPIPPPFPKDVLKSKNEHIVYL